MVSFATRAALAVCLSLATAMAPPSRTATRRRRSRTASTSSAGCSTTLCSRPRKTGSWSSTRAAWTPPGSSRPRSSARRRFTARRHRLQPQRCGPRHRRRRLGGGDGTDWRSHHRPRARGRAIVAPRGSERYSRVRDSHRRQVHVEHRLQGTGSSHGPDGGGGGPHARGRSRSALDADLAEVTGSRRYHPRPTRGAPSEPKLELGNASDVLRVRELSDRPCYGPRGELRILQPWPRANRAACHEQRHVARPLLNQGRR